MCDVAAFPQAEENRDSAEAQSTSIMLQFSLSCWRLNAANRSFADIMLSASTLYLMSQPQLYLHVVFYFARLRTVESLQNPFNTTMWLLERSVSMWLRHDLLLQLFDLSTLSWMNIGTPMFTRFLEWAITVAWIWRQWPQRLCLLLAKLGIALGSVRKLPDCRPIVSITGFCCVWLLLFVVWNHCHLLCYIHIFDLAPVFLPFYIATRQLNIFHYGTPEFTVSDRMYNLHDESTHNLQETTTLLGWGSIYGLCWSRL